jgi:hypothetical protein
MGRTGFWTSMGQNPELYGQCSQNPPIEAGFCVGASRMLRPTMAYEIVLQTTIYLSVQLVQKFGGGQTSMDAGLATITAR